jgi:hypothetical protein
MGGCAGPNQLAKNAPRVAFEALGESDQASARLVLRQLPVVLHFKPGQHVPVDFGIESRLFEVDLPELDLLVRREFFLLLRPDGPPLLSEDGLEFEERPKNSFMLGFDVRDGKPTTLHLGLAVRPEAVRGARE